MSGDPRHGSNDGSERSVKARKGRNNPKNDALTSGTRAASNFRSRLVSGKKPGNETQHSRRGGGRRGGNDQPQVYDEFNKHVTPLRLDGKNDLNDYDINKVKMANVEQTEYVPTKLCNRGQLDISDSESEHEEPSKPEGHNPRDFGFVGKKKQNVKTEDVKSEKTELTYDQKQENVTIDITETDTFFFLHIPSVAVRQEDEKIHETVTKQNKLYDMTVDSRKMKDKSAEKFAQTLNNAHRNKSVQISPPETTDSESQASAWDIYDTHQLDQKHQQRLASETNLKLSLSRSTAAAAESKNTGEGESEDAGGAGGNHAHRGSSMSMNASTLSVGGKLTGAGVGMADVEGNYDPFTAVANNGRFKRSLAVMEQAVVQNAFHDRVMLYRDHPEAVLSEKDMKMSPSAVDELLEEQNASNPDYLPSKPEEPEKKASLVHLWSFACDLTKGMTVSCMNWNKKNKDLLACGYGNLNFGNTSSGMILFWSLKNPSYPQKIVTTKHSVTSIDFCEEHPHLLAAGLYDGTVCVYDIRKNENKPDLQSLHATGKHSEPVWGVKWVTKENKINQQLTSVSSDGTVKQWSMKKGLVPQDLMTLKRIPNLAQLYGDTMEGVSREASGLGFDFPINDGTQYFTGTEDGLIHKCSVSYNEQTLENFYGHTGPVYKVCCSPFNADAFISCGADWTLNLWSQKKTKPVLTMQSGNDYVLDVQWSPSNSCVFGCVTRDGRIEIWDLEHSGLDPVVSLDVPNKELVSVSFCPELPVIVAGSTDGNIDVYRIHGVDLTGCHEKWDALQQEARIAEILYANIKHDDVQAAAAASEKKSSD